MASRKLQGESVYAEASKELTDLGSEAQRGFSGLTNAVISRTRGLSLATPNTGSGSGSTAAPNGGDADSTTTPTNDKAAMTTDEALQESETVLSRLRTEAAKRLRDIQKAEDAADEALLRFGTNIRDFLKDAVSIAPPTGGSGGGSGGAGGESREVLFESKDASGKRVIHTSRFDAQLHVIHTTTESFTKEPATGDWEDWGKEFDIKARTEEISRDIEKYPELRATMEKLVPETIPYEDFWKRYYFLRHGIDIAEARRRDLLKGKSWALLFSSDWYLHFDSKLTCFSPLQLPRPKKRSAGMRTRTTRPQPPAPRPPRLSDQAPLSLPRLSTRLPPLPRPPCSSRPSPASPTTNDRRRIATRATTLSAPARVTQATRPTAPRRRAKRTKTVMTIGSSWGCVVFLPRIDRTSSGSAWFCFPPYGVFRWEI